MRPNLRAQLLSRADRLQPANQKSRCQAGYRGNAQPSHIPVLLLKTSAHVP